MTKKKNWKTPELVVIIRCRPEENVLSACKASIRSGCGNETGPSSAIAPS